MVFYYAGTSAFLEQMGYNAFTVEYGGYYQLVMAMSLIPRALLRDTIVLLLTFNQLTGCVLLTYLMAM